MHFGGKSAIFSIFSHESDSTITNVSACFFGCLPLTLDLTIVANRSFIHKLDSQTNKGAILLACDSYNKVKVCKNA